MFENLFKRCSHEYKQVGFIPVVDFNEEGSFNVPCYFLECKHCGKRKVLREASYAYSDAFLDMLDLWIKGQFKINFKEFDLKEMTKEEPRKNDSKYEHALEQIRHELERLELPMHDSNGRLIVNNIKGIIQNILSEEGPDEETK